MLPSLHVTRLLLVLTLASIGCERVDRALGERTEILEGRRLIERYARAVEPLDDLREQWVEAVREVGRSEDVKAVARAVEKQVVPRLVRYQKAIEDVGADLADRPELAKIHARMEAAHAELAGALDQFRDNVTAEDYALRSEELSRAIERFHTSQARYRDELRALYERYSVTLTP